ncbi:MAG: polysulfide reductase NrfD [Deltaproteobacteria bacterium]|nr:polysulfide reductase NrfD [Deltaproteobacteria bacterium]
MSPSEFVSTSHHPLADGHAWGWEIAVYLFLGGFTAGLLVLSGLARRRGPRATGEPGFALASSGLSIVGLGAISLGMLALFLDLAHKPFVWRLYVTMEPRSPMSWGAWILLLVYPVLLTGIALDPPRALRDRVPALARLARYAEDERVRRGLGLASIAAGLALGVYTGILLSALGARPLWSSGLLGPLFLVSGLSTGAAFAHMASPLAEERHRLARLDNLLIAVELALIALYLIGLASSTEAHAEAAKLLLGGPYTAVFWVVVVGVGLVAPLAIQALTVAGRIAPTHVAPVLVLIGGIVLRFVLVFAGQASHWSRL